MDKDTVIRIVTKAAKHVQFLFPIKYKNEGLPQDQIQEQITIWWSYAEKMQQQVELDMLSIENASNELKTRIGKSERLLRDLSKNEAVTNSWTDLPKPHHEFMIYCDKQICEELLFSPFLNPPILTNEEEKKEKYKNIVGLAKSTIRMLSKGFVSPETAVLSALENAASEKKRFGSITLRKHSLGLSIDAQHALADELLNYCKYLQYPEKEITYLEESIRRFFKDKPRDLAIDFESLFKSEKHQELIVTALKELELISFDGKWLGKKSQLGTLKDVLERRDYFLDEIPKSDEKLVPLLAQFFKIKVSDRTTRERPKDDMELKADLTAKLPKLP